jgi:hypothetical protein
VAIYYSVAGLTAIFAAAVIPIIIMGVSLEVGKLVATIWLKQNWDTAPILIRTYLIAAIIVLMAITSLGIFGFLSKAHQDQTIPSGDVAAKVSLIDEKIKTERENIDANRKTLTQLDAAVDQVMARSTSEEGAAKSSQIRKSQQKERGQLLADNERSQKAISVLQTEKAPIAAELRKVEAEVGPIKYIAAFFYGETNPTILEKAVTWVIITLIVVFDPLAVILLLASQTSFQQFREREETEEDLKVKEFFERGKEIAQKLDAEARAKADDGPLAETQIEQAKKLYADGPIERTVYEPDDGPLTEDQVEQIKAKVAEQHPYLNEPFKHFENLTPMVAKIEEPPKIDVRVNEYLVDAELIDALEGTVNRLQQENLDMQAEVMVLKKENLTAKIAKHGYSSEGGIIKLADETIPQAEFDRIMNYSKYIQNEEQTEGSRWNAINTKISEEEYIKHAQQNNDNSDHPA